MRTITVNIDESVYQKFMTLVELFPKNKLKITSDDKQKKLEALQDNIRKSLEDAKAGRSKVIKIIKLKN